MFALDMIDNLEKVFSYESTIAQISLNRGELVAGDA